MSYEQRGPVDRSVNLSVATSSAATAAAPFASPLARQATASNISLDHHQDTDHDLAPNLMVESDALGQLHSQIDRLENLYAHFEFMMREVRSILK